MFNILTLVADSCRASTYFDARTPVLDEHFEVVEAGAQATFTLPAHVAMFEGFYPLANIDRPLYNRFKLRLTDHSYQKSRKSLIDIPSYLRHHVCLPQMLYDFGYQTSCYGGVGWFRGNNPLSRGFANFKYIPDASKAIAESIKRIPHDSPFYWVINFGITHRPYQWVGMPSGLPQVTSPASGIGYTSGFNTQLYLRQVAALEWLDSKLAALFTHILENVNSPTVVCFCADHGDCFGEDGCYGHGFYHPSVMKVPLGWSVLDRRVRAVEDYVADLV